MADNEEDAKLIRAAVERTKKATNAGKGGNYSRYTRRRQFGAAGLAFGAFGGAGYGQPPSPAVAPAVSPPPPAQYMPAQPGFKGRGSGVGRGAPRACFRYLSFLFFLDLHF